MGQALGLGGPVGSGPVGSGPVGVGPIGSAAPGDIVRREERLRLDVMRVPSERVRLVRRIVTETRMIPVQVRREVLDVERSPVDGAAVAAELNPVPGRVRAPSEILLHEEVPVVTFEVRPVERIRVSIQEFSGETVVREQVASEQVDVVTIPPPATRV